ncbi:hypothetical protein ABH917_004150 [Thermobifida halotolerans]
MTSAPPASSPEEVRTVGRLTVCDAVGGTGEGDDDGNNGRDSPPRRCRHRVLRRAAGGSPGVRRFPRSADTHHPAGHGPRRADRQRDLPAAGRRRCAARPGAHHLRRRRSRGVHPDLRAEGALRHRPRPAVRGHRPDRPERRRPSGGDHRRRGRGHHGRQAGRGRSRGRHRGLPGRGHGQRGRQPVGTGVDGGRGVQRLRRGDDGGRGRPGSPAGAVVRGGRAVQFHLLHLVGHGRTPGAGRPFPTDRPGRGAVARHRGELSEGQRAQHPDPGPHLVVDLGVRDHPRDGGSLRTAAGGAGRRAGTADLGTRPGRAGAALGGAEGRPRPGGAGRGREPALPPAGQRAPRADRHPHRRAGRRGGHHRDRGGSGGTRLPAHRGAAARTPRLGGLAADPHRSARRGRAVALRAAAAGRALPEG